MYKRFILSFLIVFSSSKVHANQSDSWYEQIKKQGHTGTQHIFGMIGVSLENNPSENTKVPISELISLAKQGDPIAQYDLGMVYLKGDKVTKDREAALFWLDQSAKQEDAWAQYQLGWMSYKGVGGVKQNKEEGIDWYKLAAEQGHADAQYELGMIYMKDKVLANIDKTKIIGLLQKPTKQGLTDAQNQLDQIFNNSGTEVKQNLQESVYWWNQAAEQGHADAQYYLAWMYFAGTGVEQNNEMATHWWNQAAEQGHILSQKQLDSLNDNDSSILTAIGYVLLAIVILVGGLMTFPFSLIFIILLL